MADLIDVVSQISTPVKVGWLICLAWAAMQLEWYRRVRTEKPEPEHRSAPARPEAVSGPARTDSLVESDSFAESDRALDSGSAADGGSLDPADDHPPPVQ